MSLSAVTYLPRILILLVPASFLFRTVSRKGRSAARALAWSSAAQLVSAVLMLGFALNDRSVTEAEFA